MIEFRLTVNALGNTRFGYSPLAEAATSIRLLSASSPGFVMQPWLSDVRHQLGKVDMRLLTAIAPPGKWAADFLFPWTTDPKVTVERQLDELAALPKEHLIEDMEGCWTTREMPDVLRQAIQRSGAGLGTVIAEALWQYWTAAIAPYWSRIRAVVDDDVSVRGAVALSRGIISVFDDLHPEVPLHGGVIRVDKPQHAAKVYQGQDALTLIPSVFVWPNLVMGMKRRTRSA